jgi:hypothetical protein
MNHCDKSRDQEVKPQEQAVTEAMSSAAGRGGRWRLWVAALWGLLLSPLNLLWNFANGRPNPEISSAEYAGEITGIILFLPLLFLVVASIRNLFVKKSS